jgi:hypothetical protein
MSIGDITSIDFLVPAKVTTGENSILVNVDINKRKVYQKVGDEVLEWGEQDTKQFFAKLDGVMNPPENMYANQFGSEEDVEEIKQRFENIQEGEEWETK